MFYPTHFYPIPPEIAVQIYDEFSTEFSKE
jgi:hypothetical protein